MRIAENLIEINEPSVKALFLMKVVHDEPTLDRGECQIMGVCDNSPIYLTLQQIMSWLEPVEGERVYWFNHSTGMMGVDICDITPAKGMTYVACNTLTLQAEKDGILREIVDMCEVVK